MIKKIYLSLFLLFVFFSSFTLDSVDAADIDERYRIGGGFGNSYFIKDDGSFWPWGLNRVTQLGFTDGENRAYPNRLDSSNFRGEKVVKVKSYGETTLVQTESGKLYSLGRPHGAPTLLNGGNVVLDFSSNNSYEGNSNDHSSAGFVNTDGTVSIYGSAYVGGFGNGLGGFGASNTCGSGYITYTPSKVLTSASFETCASNTAYKRIVEGSQKYLTNVRLISTYSNFWYAVASDGIYSWGNTHSGNFATKNNNITAAFANDIVKIESNSQIYALDKTGGVWVWSGVQGTPVRVTLNESIKDIAISPTHVLFLGVSGKLYGLGNNTYGQLGTALGSSGSTSAQYLGISDIKNIGVGDYHSLLIDINNNIWTFGRNDFTQLANEDDNTVKEFRTVPNISNISTLHAQYFHTVLINNSNKMLTAGTSRGGHLGDNSNVFVERYDFGSDPVISVKGNSNSGHQYAFTTQGGNAYNIGESWRVGRGYDGVASNMMGQLNTRAPNFTNTKLKDTTQGYVSGAGISTNGELLTWGYDIGGQIGLGYLSTQIWGAEGPGPGVSYAFTKPPKSVGISFKKVESSYGSYTALSDEGDLYTWGGSSNFRLARTLVDGSREYDVTKVEGIPKMKDVVMGLYHGLAIDIEGRVWSWGLGSSGQLGLGSNSSSSTLKRIPNLENISKIGAGDHSSFAIDNNGKLYAWGLNKYGQLGLSDKVNRNAPRDTGLSNVKMVSGGSDHTVALLNTGQISVAGSDAFGQLGLGQLNNKPIKREVFFKPLINLNTIQNQQLSSGNTLKVSGTVESVNTGQAIEIKYVIEGPSNAQTKVLKTFTAKSIPESFNIELKIDNSWLVGGYTIFIVAKDASGLESREPVTFGVTDITKPEIAVNPINKDWTKTPIDINISLSDLGGSGYRDFRYNLRKTGVVSDWTNYITDSSYSVQINSTGEYMLDIEARDYSGNIRSVSTGPYYFDNTIPNLPEITLNSDDWVTKSSYTILGTGDLGSGLSKIEHRIVGYNDWATYNGEVIIPDSLNGLITIESRAIDKLGNISLSSYKTAKIDKTPSIITINPNGNNNYEKSHDVIINGFDNESGIGKVEYIWSSSTTITNEVYNNIDIIGLSNGVSTPTGLTGDYYLHVKITDKVGNISTLVSNVYKLDNTPPEVGSIQLLMDELGKLKIKVTGVTDNHVGIDETSAYNYKMDSGAYVGWSGDNFTFTNIQGNREYSITYKLKDKLGNEKTIDVPTKGLSLTEHPLSIKLDKLESKSFTFSIIEGNNTTGSKYEFYAKDLAGNEIGNKSLFSEALSDRKIDGLSPNDRYSIWAKSKNKNGLSTNPDKKMLDVFTRSENIDSVRITGITDSKLTVDLTNSSLNINKPETYLEVRRSDNGLKVSESAFSLVEKGRTLNGLTPGVRYELWGKVRNSESVENEAVKYINEFYMNSTPEIDLKLVKNKYSEVEGFNKIQVKGKIKDLDIIPVGDPLDIYYTIKNSSGNIISDHDNVKLGREIATGDWMDINYDISLTNSLVEGNYTIEVKVMDDQLEEAIDTDSFLVDRTNPIGILEVINDNLNDEKGKYIFTTKINNVDGNIAGLHEKAYLIEKSYENDAFETLFDWSSELIQEDSSVLSNSKYTYKAKIRDQVGHVTETNLVEFVSAPKVSKLKDGETRYLISDPSTVVIKWENPLSLDRSVFIEIRRSGNLVAVVKNGNQFNDSNLDYEKDYNYELIAVSRDRAGNRIESLPEKLTVQTGIPILEFDLDTDYDITKKVYNLYQTVFGTGVVVAGEIFYKPGGNVSIEGIGDNVDFTIDSIRLTPMETKKFPLEFNSSVGEEIKIRAFVKESTISNEVILDGVVKEKPLIIETLSNKDYLNKFKK